MGVHAPHLPHQVIICCAVHDAGEGLDVVTTWHLLYQLHAGIPADSKGNMDQETGFRAAGE